jgi:cytoskeletal protein CcmA (bactofilin family)
MKGLRVSAGAFCVILDRPVDETVLIGPALALPFEFRRMVSWGYRGEIFWGAKMTKELARDNLAAAYAGVRPAMAANVETADKTVNMSVLGPDIHVTGNIEAIVDLHIEGKVTGDVRCATLVMGAESAVTGSIKADRVRVSGLVDGAIDTTDLAIESSARVKGDVTYSRIRIASGGVIEGSLTHRPLMAEDSSEEKRLKLVDPQPQPEPKALYYE